MRTAILILALSLCGPVHAAQMAFAGLPDGGLLFKKVQSVRERKFSDLSNRKPISAAVPPPWPPSCATPTGWMSMKNR